MLSYHEQKNANRAADEVRPLTVSIDEGKGMYISGHT